MGITEIDRRARELSALIRAQLRLIRNLEEDGKDLTSAKIVLDSLRVSLFLATRDLNRAQRPVSPHAQKDTDGTFPVCESNPELAFASKRALQCHVTELGGEPSLKFGDDIVGVPNKIDTKDGGEQLGAQGVHFEFRPLTNDEKNAFVNSLDAEGKRILVQLSEKAVRLGKSAA